MTQPFQVTFDAHDPAALAAFWALALGYQEEPPPPGFATWEDFARSINLPESEWNNFSAVVAPDRQAPRLFFQKVPEGKTAKNRVHLDVNASQGKGHGPDGWALVTAHVDRLTAAGATVTREVNEPHGRCIVMADPEGNEFCVQ
jgi:hypothetical protein